MSYGNNAKKCAKSVYEEMEDMSKENEISRIH